MLPIDDLRAGAAFARTVSAADAGVREEAAAIVERVRTGGDAALRELTLRFDGADLPDPRIDPAGIEEGSRTVPAELAQALERLAARLRALAERQLPRPWAERADGVRFGEVVTPLQRVGCYVPGGRAAYPSTVLMTAVPAATAGVPAIMVCTPPGPDGSVDPLVLAACAIAGVTDVVRAGGAQAVAALAYGTESIRPVDRIVGPGNAWVTAAKALVAGDVGIDGLAGPTELAVVADGGADPAALAADLIAQAEHDPQAEAFLVTWDEALVPGVAAALERVLAGAARREILDASLPRARALLVRDADHAAEVVDAIAPEHLQVLTDDPEGFVKRVRAFGAAFLGVSTPVSLGDYGFGSNHVLPTMGTARFASGLRASDFVTVSSVVEATPEGLAAAAPDVTRLARAEGLDGHARAVEVRLP